MQKIVLLGAGNVASHLYGAFQQSKEAEVIQIYNRSGQALKAFEKSVATTTSLSALVDADVYIVAVSDDAIKNLVLEIESTNVLVAHTSGSVPLLATAKRNGVFYPLQTFSKNTAVDFSTIPICIEATYDIDVAVLRLLGKSISKKVFLASTKKRKSLHLAAVFACNFSNHLYSLAERICEENQVPFEFLRPLIAETARKIELNSPKNVQTGPAKRHDRETIAFHLSQLSSPELKEIYTLLTRSIQAENEPKL